MKFIVVILVAVGLITEKTFSRMIDCNAPTASVIRIAGAYIKYHIEDEDLKGKINSCTEFFCNNKDETCPFIQEKFPSGLESCDALLEGMNIKDLLNHHMIDIVQKFSDNMFDSCEVLGDCDSGETVETADEVVQKMMENKKCSQEVVKNIMSSDMVKGFMEGSGKMDWEAILKPMKDLCMGIMRKNASKLMNTFRDTLSKAGLTDETIDNLLTCGTQIVNFAKNKMGSK